MVQLCTLSFFLMFVPGNFMSLAILTKYGFKRCVSHDVFNIIDYGWWIYSYDRRYF
jgi:hypothetical protein